MGFHSSIGERCVSNAVVSSSFGGAGSSGQHAASVQKPAGGRDFVGAGGTASSTRWGHPARSPGPVLRDALGDLVIDMRHGQPFSDL